MKEQYFSDENLAQVTQSLLQSACDKSHQRNLFLKPEKSALIVLDMQNYFLEPSSHAFIPSAPAIIGNIQKLVEIFISKSRPVIFTRHVNSGEDAGMMKKWWKDLLLISDPASEIIPQLIEYDADVIVKTQYDAFYNTELEEMLRNNGVEHIVICGVMTHLCCESTARSAFVRGFMVHFPLDGTATYNREFHLSTIRNLSHGFASILTVQDVMNQMVRDAEDN
ncbi:MAG: isochorismatase family protein [Candidatus Electryonea clarkiae]|nr:isochorismatase family protein [Candidatus Electryonea clarkiae]MDP8285044.1 isochorismatase family protein [Candidatus Electryonea clarkiae]